MAIEQKKRKVKRSFRTYVRSLSGMKYGVWARTAENVKEGSRGPL